MWHGLQLAVDATIASGCPVHSGRAITQAALWMKRDTCPELTWARRCCLLVHGIEVGHWFGAKQRRSSVSWCATGLQSYLGLTLPGPWGGLPSMQWLRSGRLQTLCSICHLHVERIATRPSPSCARLSLTADTNSLCWLSALPLC